MHYKENSFWLYCIHDDFKVATRLKGQSFENDWLKVEKNGDITVKGSHAKGYAWDGCSPKFSCFDLIIGTPDGVIDPASKKPMTYYASMVHDALYQFYYERIFSRAEIDRLFLTMLDGFKLKYCYYAVVRMIGWYFVGKKPSALQGLIGDKFARQRSG